jgi:hypothetical protein
MGFEMKRTRPVRTVLDQHRLAPACPECGTKVSMTVGEARENPTARCPNGHQFTVDAQKLERMAGDIQRQVDDLLG